MPELNSAMNILAVAASRRGIGRLLRRFFWHYVQAEREEPVLEGKLQRSRVVEHDTWSKVFGLFPFGRRPIEMRIQRIRSPINRGFLST